MYLALVFPEFDWGSVNPNLIKFSQLYKMISIRQKKFSPSKHAVMIITMQAMKYVFAYCSQTRQCRRNIMGSISPTCNSIRVFHHGYFIYQYVSILLHN